MKEPVIPKEVEVKRGRLSNHAKIMLLSFLSGLPALAFVVVTLINGAFSMLSIFTMGVVVVGTYFFCFSLIYGLVVRPWQVVSNIVAAMKERDYTLRIRYPSIDDPLGLTFAELNDLIDYQQNQRLGLMETHELLFKILQEIEAAVLCFDEDEKLVMANQYARKLYLCKENAPLRGTAEELNLKQYLGIDVRSVHEIRFPAHSSRWMVKRSSYRENGLLHTMLLIADLHGPLRAEELDAWKKLIRVLGHELNNSMTPLKSVTDSLNRIVTRDPLPEDWRKDMDEGLSMIGRRVDGLSRFVKGYSDLARLPLPQKEVFDVKKFMTRATIFDSRAAIELVEGPPCSIEGDEGQLEQVLINLLKNAVEAMSDSEGKVVATWELGESELKIIVLDEGHGLSGDDNVFVPFFSTKASGSGIGLALSRQIAEAHSGRLTLENRSDRSGCVATLALPVA